MGPVHSLLKGVFANINSDNGFGFNVYQSKSSDPLKTVVHAGPQNIGLPVALHVPVGANDHDTSDAGVVIVDNKVSAHEFYLWRWNNDRPTASIHRTWSTKSSGQGARLGVSASGLPGLFGIIRGHEVNTPGYKIEHALQISLSHDGTCGNQLQNKVVWPAISTDWFCKSRPELCSGNIPYGALLALPPGVNTAGLGLSEPGRRLAAALQNYGTYAVDGGLPELAGRPGDRSRGQAGADQGHAENLSALAHGAEQQSRANRFRRRNAAGRELRLRFTRSMRHPLQSSEDATLPAELGEPGPRRGLEPAMASGGHASLPGPSARQLERAMLVRARNALKRSNSSASMAEEL